MRTILLLITLFVLSSCTTAREEVQSGKVYIGMSKRNVVSALSMTTLSEDAFLGGCYRNYVSDLRLEVLSSSSRSVYFIFEDVYQPTVGCDRIKVGDGKLAQIVYSRSDADKYVQSKKSKKVVKKTQPKKEKKETNSNNSSGSSGSAFFISSRGDIITNNHVIENCKSQPKIKYNNKDVTANIVATDRMLDLALLKADLRNTKYISFSRDEPRKLQKIIAAGYPFGQYLSDDLKFTSGIVSSLKGPGDDSTLVQVDAALNVGNSGGPIVDESSGQLVAVSVLTMDKSIAEGQNFGIKTSSVKNFLNANKVKVPFGFNFNRDVADSLEKSTLYVYCY